MKRKELYSLSFKYLKLNKKMSIRSMIPLILCITFLTVSVFIFFEFKIVVMNNVKEEKLYSSITVKYSETDRWYMMPKYQESIEDNSHIKESVSYKEVYVGCRNTYIPETREFIIDYPKITIDDNTYSIKINGSNANTIKFYNLKNNTCILEDEKTYMRDNNLGNPILAGSEIKANEKSIMINSKLLDDLNLNYEDVIGKKVSYKTSIEATSLYYNNIKYEVKDEYINIFSNYIIKGVFNDNIYSIPSRNISEDAIFWISDDNIYEGDLYTYDVENYRCYYNENPIELANKITSEGKFFLPDYISRKPDDIFCSLYEYDSFNASYDAYNEICKYAKLSVDEGNVINNCYMPTMVLKDYIDVYPKITIMILGSLTLTISVFIATIINIVLIIDYQKSRKKQFFGMLKALGLNDNEVKNISSYQLNLQCLISISFSFVISLVLGLIITLRWNSKIKTTNYDSYGIYDINFCHTLIVFMIVGLIIYAFVKIISLIYNKFSRNLEIVDALKEE